jgi:restriction endonuclease S subunit
VIALPPLAEQQAIVDHLRRHALRLDATISVVEGGILRLKEYRTALISAAVTGKIDVREEVA